jgi:HSP20 family protein
MYRTLFPSDLFAELDRLQRQVQRFTGPTTSIRGFGRNGFPALNVGGTPDSVEIYAFAPGLDPAKLDVTIERGVLTLSGERPGDVPADANKAVVHINERFAGRFSRAVSLSDDVDPNRVAAKYSDGVLHISVKRRESAQPRRIEIQ